MTAIKNGGDARCLTDGSGRAARTPRPERTAADRDDAIRQCGTALVDTGAVDPTYVDAMLEREQSISTYVGEGVAIPHGTVAGKDAVHRDAAGRPAVPGRRRLGRRDGRRCASASRRVGDGHVGILAELAQILLDPDRAAAAARGRPRPTTWYGCSQPAGEEEAA